eukprot:31072-Pelagococcus_subviridis.AAC.7
MNRPLYTTSAPVMGADTSSGDFVVSFKPARTKPQFATGPQKCVVFGPVGEATHRANAELCIAGVHTR